MIHNRKTTPPTPILDCIVVAPEISSVSENATSQSSNHDADKDQEDNNNDNIKGPDRTGGAEPRSRPTSRGITKHGKGSGKLKGDQNKIRVSQLTFTFRLLTENAPLPFLVVLPPTAAYSKSQPAFLSCSHIRDPLHQLEHKHLQSCFSTTLPSPIIHVPAILNGLSGT